MVNSMDLPEEIYVLVLEHDISDKQRGDHPEHKTKPIIMETNASLATLNHARGLMKLWRDYGETKIGRVIFSDLDQVNPVPVCGKLLLPEDEKLDDLVNSLGEIFLNKDVRPPLPAMSDSTRAHLRLKALEWVRSI